MPTGILQDDDGDIKLVGGSMVFGETTYQQQRDLLILKKGDLRTSPGVGVGLPDYIDDEEPEALLREITTQFQKDGMTVVKVALDNIIAYYK